MLRLAAVFLGIAAASNAQTKTLRVFSEFTRINPFGKVVKFDQGGEPRHILSPGLARNAHASFRVVVTLDKPAGIYLDIAQNPENSVKATLYREVFENHGGEWIPDRLVPVKIPYGGMVPSTNIPGQNTVTFWLDVWVDRNAPVDRIKLEPQVYVNDDWVVYPMEVRILEPVLPDTRIVAGELPPVNTPSDRAALGPLRALFCGAGEKAIRAEGMTARALIRRNVQQHLAIGRNGANTRAALLKSIGAVDVKSWCAAPARTASAGPEWYLRFRDLLFRSLSAE